MYVYVIIFLNFYFEVPNYTNLYVQVSLYLKVSLL